MKRKLRRDLLVLLSPLTTVNLRPRDSRFRLLRWLPSHTPLLTLPSQLARMLSGVSVLRCVPQLRRVANAPMLTACLRSRQPEEAALPSQPLLRKRFAEIIAKADSGTVPHVVFSFVTEYQIRGLLLQDSLLENKDKLHFSMVRSFCTFSKSRATEQESHQLRWQS